MSDTVRIYLLRQHVEAHKSRERAMFTVAAVSALLDELSRLRGREEEAHREHWQFQQAVKQLFGWAGLRAVLRHQLLAAPTNQKGDQDGGKHGGGL